MPYDKTKFTRISLDLTHEEYRKLHQVVTERLSRKSDYIRAAITEKIDSERPNAKSGKTGRSN